MKDYARMSPEQQRAYSDGVLDCIDHMIDCAARAEAEKSSIIEAAYRIAAGDLAVVRNKQINAGPQS